MDADDVNELAEGVRRAVAISEGAKESVAGLRLMLDTLVQILKGRGDLGEGHVRMLERFRDRARTSELKIELGDAPDKYAVENSVVDCDARMHLCHGRCCSFNVKLSRQDLEERELAWRIEEPYYLAHNREGYCIYQTRDTGFCGNYEFRPAPCRSYDCRQDHRIWIDFEQRIPAPMAPGLVTIRRNPDAVAKAAAQWTPTPAPAPSSDK